MRRFLMRKAGSQEGVILAFFPAFLIFKVRNEEEFLV
jgi:hypothetical protein